MNDLTHVQDLGFPKPEQKEESLMQVSESRAVAEVQAGYVIAKRFPRNESECYMKIIEACKRPFLAEKAMYAFPKGGTVVTGASIRLAECMAQAWGNLECGVREISQINGMSVAEAYAIDLQTNSRCIKIFHVPHTRDRKNPATKKMEKIRMTDARDIYEVVANQGARRLRACILAILPPDVTEAAVERCKKTMESSDIPLSERIRQMIVAFDEFGVKVEHLEKRLGHKLESTIGAELVTLTNIFKSIRDGMADREDFFDIGLKNNAADAKLDEILSDKKTKIDKKTGEVTSDGKQLE